MATEYTGLERRSSAPQRRAMHQNEIGWHLDKKVPLSLIAAMIVQVVVVVMFFADIKRDVELLKAKTSSIEQRYDDDKFTLRDNISLLRDQFNSINAKLDRLIERSKL